MKNFYRLGIERKIMCGLWVMASGLLLLVGCSRKITESGQASFYGAGDGFNGKKTANGETFNKNKLTAAHKTLPFGTIVKVTNLSNGQSVKVRINDRGPFVKGRIIDLSEKAAKKIDMRTKGVAEVKLRYKKK
jgi:rare lipoprotein A